VAIAATLVSLLMLALTTQGASAGAIYITHRGKIPSGGHGAYEVGNGARIANKAYGYYIGWTAAGSTFTNTGGRAGHRYGRINNASINICGWIHHSALDRRTKKSGRSGCSIALASKIAHRLTIGQNFSTRAETRGVDPVVSIPVKDPNCHLFYNYFDDDRFQTGRLRESGGKLGAGTADLGHVGYRYQTRDGKAVVVRDASGRWGFTQTKCVDLTKVPHMYNDPD
jgi:hypothetical protein